MDLEDDGKLHGCGCVEVREGGNGREKSEKQEGGGEEGTMSEPQRNMFLPHKPIFILRTWRRHHFQSQLVVRRVHGMCYDPTWPQFLESVPVHHKCPRRLRLLLLG